MEKFIVQIRTINKIKDLAFNSKRCDYDVLDGPSFILKLNKHSNRFSYFGDSFDLSDSAYEDIEKLVMDFVGKWARGLFLPWKEED